MILAHADRGDIARETGDITGSGGAENSSIPTQLAVAVVPPTFGGASDDTTSLVSTGTDGGDVTGETGHLNRSGRAGGGSVTESTPVIVPPAFGGATEDDARVFPAGTDGGDVAGGAGHLNGNVRVSEGPVTELGRIVHSPAFGGAPDNGARMKLASGKEGLLGARRILVGVSRDK